MFSEYVEMSKKVSLIVLLGCVEVYELSLVLSLALIAVLATTNITTKAKKAKVRLLYEIAIVCFILFALNNI